MGEPLGQCWTLPWLLADGLCGVGGACRCPRVLWGSLASQLPAVCTDPGGCRACAGLVCRPVHSRCLLQGPGQGPTRAQPLRPPVALVGRFQACGTFCAAAGAVLPDPSRTHGSGQGWLRVQLWAEERQQVAVLSPGCGERLPGPLELAGARSLKSVSSGQQTPGTARKAGCW